MKTGHLNRPKTDEIIYPIHKKIIAIENSKNAPMYFIFHISSNPDLSLALLYSFDLLNGIGFLKDFRMASSQRGS